MARWNPHPKRSHRLHAGVPLALLLASLARTAVAQEAATQTLPVGMDPAAPNVSTLPGGMSPSFGVPPEKPSDWRFDFHGMLTAPLRAGLNTRDNPLPGQQETVLHAPPVVPDDLETFSHTGVVPTPFTQLNFSYGNSIVTGTVTLLARVNSVSAGFFDPSAQMGINDAFVSINVPSLPKNMALNVKAGAFSNRYGSMGEYDLGQYGTPLIAALNGVGENITATFGFGDLTLQVEQGFLGNSNRPGGGVAPDGWNGFADPRAGAGFVNHLHAAASFKRQVTLGGHYISAFTQDERASLNQPDGKLRILAGDLRLSLARFGHFYGAFAHTNADYSTSVGRIVEVLNVKGGGGLDDNYFSTLSASSGTGTGKLTVIGGQYNLSVGRLVSYPVAFLPDGPDLYVSVFGMYTSVDSPKPLDDGRKRLKFGAEATYSVLPWLALSGRYDRVAPNMDDQRYSFAVLSPRLIFRTNWDSRDQLVLQYSRWFNGSRTTVRTGYPPREDITVVPDENMISLSASMWW
ncbi:MAG: hypothetical protein QM756_03225 [Polyangiaceae bacterium]